MLRPLSRTITPRPFSISANHSAWLRESRALRNAASGRQASTASAVQDTAKEVIASSAGSSDIITAVLRLPLEYVHDTLHVPWLWTIPLAALTIRALLYFPVTLTTRKALQRRLALSPLISAHKPWYRREAISLARRGARKNPLMHQQSLMRKLTSDLSNRYDCGLGKTLLLPIVQLPVFLGMSWTLRDLMGMSSALKDFVYDIFGYPASSAGAEAATAVTAAPGMFTEGLPWALDLTAADPTGTLSYVVSAIMLSQTLLSARGMGRSTVLSRLLLVLSLTIGPLMANAPTGILYYWACSSGMALVVNGWLDWRYPLRRFRPCKRPVINYGAKKR